MFSYKEVHKELDRITALVPNLPTFKIEGQKFVDYTNPWTRSTLLKSQPVVHTLGTNPEKQYNLIYQVDVFTPYGNGYENNDTIVESILNEFPTHTIIESDNYSIMITNAYCLNGSVQDEKYYHNIVRIDISVYTNG